MASSGSINFNRTRDEIIKAALRACRVIGAAEVPAAHYVQNAAEALNLMVKQWMSKGHYLWCRTSGTVFLTESQESYSLGTGGDRATESYIQTALNGDHTSSDTTLLVDSTTGM